MGERGPMSKREARQRQEPPVAVKLREVTPGGPYPEPPEGLVPSVEAEWHELWRSEANGWLSTIDRPALERLFEYRSERARIMAFLKTLPPEQLVVTGSRGQERPHPLFDMTMRLEREIRGLESLMGALPIPRARLGLVVGEAKRTWQEVARVESAPPDAAELEAIGLGVVTPIDDLL